jgi:hypothetical protein
MKKNYIVEVMVTILFILDVFSYSLDFKFSRYEKICIEKKFNARFTKLNNGFN